MGIFKSRRQPAGGKGGKTIIAPGCVLSGEFHELKGDMHVDGRIDGVIDSAYNVSIGASGEMVGVLKAKSVVVSGVLEGTISCERMEILATGRVLGELLCSDVSIESGGRFIGESRELTEGGMVVGLPENKRERYRAALEHMETVEESEPAQEVIQQKP